MNIDDSNKRKKTHTHDKVRLSWSVLLCLCSLNIAAEIKLPTMISDGMVMQRETPVEIWGKGDPGEIVNLSFSKNNIPVAIKGEKFRKSYSAITDKDGNWSIILPSLKHGGPYTMNINDKVLNDILIGDVWL